MRMNEKLSKAYVAKQSALIVSCFASFVFSKCFFFSKIILFFVFNDEACPSLKSIIAAPVQHPFQ